MVTNADQRTRLLIEGTIPILREKDIMSLSRADSLAKLIYLAVQFIYTAKRPQDLAILALLSSWVAKFVMQPTALHCTSTFGDIIWRMRGVRPPNNTITTLFSAVIRQLNDNKQTRHLLHTIYCQVSKSCTRRPLHFYIRALKKEKERFSAYLGRPRAHLNNLSIKSQ